MRSRPRVIGLATALLALLLTTTSSASETSAAPTAFTSLSTAPSGCKITNPSGTFTATSADRSMGFAMPAFLGCAGILDGAGDLSSPAFTQGQFSSAYVASSAANPTQTIGIASCSAGACAPQSLLLTLAPSTGVLSLAPAAGGSAVLSSLGTGSQQGEVGDDNHKVTPEPGSLALLATGFVFMGGVLRRRSTKRRQNAE